MGITLVRDKKTNEIKPDGLPVLRRPIRFSAGYTFESDKNSKCRCFIIVAFTYLIFLEVV